MKIMETSALLSRLIPRCAFTAAIAALILVTSDAGTTPRSSAAEQELRQITQEMLDAVAPGNTDVWRKYLDERIVHVDESGTVRTRDQLLAEFGPLPAGLVGSMKIDRFKVELHGDTAVVAFETQEHLDFHGQVLRSRFRGSDTWLKTSQGWRLVAEQISAVLKDPPAISLPQQQLCAYDGVYFLTEEITAKLSCTSQGVLAQRPDRAPVTYLPEVLDVFFVPGQPRTRRIFQRDVRGAVTGFVDRREGEDVRWMRAQ